MGTLALSQASFLLWKVRGPPLGCFSGGERSREGLVPAHHESSQPLAAREALVAWASPSGGCLYCRWTAEGGLQWSTRPHLLCPDWGGRSRGGRGLLGREKKFRKFPLGMKGIKEPCPGTFTLPRVCDLSPPLQLASVSPE